MKIAFTHVDLPNESKGGVAHQVHYLANSLVDRGHEVTVFSFSPVFDECRYKVVTCRRKFKIRGAARLDTFLFASVLAKQDFSKFDVLHTNGDNYLLGDRHPQLRTFYGSARDEAKSAQTLKRRIYQNIIAKLEDRSLKVADLNVGISQATREQLPTIERIIPCGVDLSNFKPGPKSEHPTLLFVGTVGGRKRGAWLNEIFQKEIRPQVPNAELWCVTDAPMEGEGVVNFGRVPFQQLVTLFQQAWVFCLPSTYEGFGVPYVEAMASGTPAVATPNPGAREVLAGGKYGLLAEDEKLGGGIADLLRDAGKRQALIEVGLQRAQDYSWPNVASLYETAYEDAIARTTKSTAGARA